MKNLKILAFFFAVLVACNSGPGKGKETGDSVQQLLRSLRDSIRKHPEDTLLKYELITSLEEGGHYREAIDLLDSLNISKGDSADPKKYFNYLFKRASLLAMAGDTAEAIKTMELYVIPGELTESGLQLASFYAEMKDPRTISICDAMNKNDASGKDPEPDYLKGVYYYNIDDYPKALEQFNSCIKKDYTFLDAYMEKGRILYKMNKYADAISVYDLAISVSNSFADAHYWKGKCLEALGEKAEAKISYQRAYAFDKSLTEAKEEAERIKD